MKNYKKVLKITVLVVLALVLIAVAAPYLFKGKIIESIKKSLNDNLNAKVDFKEADLSIFRNFPNATVNLEKLAVVNIAPFEGDTLFYAGDIELNMGLSELFKGGASPMKITRFKVDSAKVRVLVNESGTGNYDIAKTPDSAPEASTEESSNFEFSVAEYQLTNSYFQYFDEGSGIEFTMHDINHSGSGDLSLQNSELNTHTDALVSFAIDSVNYLNRNPVQLDALLGIDLENSTYSFLKNEAMVNQLPLEFEGFVKLNEENTEVKIAFQTPSSDFKNFLALIPETYSKNIDEVKTLGKFEVKGLIEGMVDETHIPKIDISMQSENASFKYPNLPRAVENINIKTFIVNKTGLVKDTYIDVQKLAFTIAEDAFNMNGKFSNLVENPFINAHIDGRLNLANISNAYPVATDTPLSGILDLDVSTAFDMKTIENGNYKKTKNKGNLVLKEFEYSSEELAQPLTIHKADLTFNPETVTLNALDTKLGKTDLKANGRITNLLGYMFNDEAIKGNFNMRSDVFAVSDFMVSDAEEETESEPTSATPQAEEPQIKIPSFLDCTIQARANRVLYDNITLKDVKGTMVVADEKARLVNLSSSVFDGGLALNGSVSTKTETPEFDMNLNIDAFNIGSSFNQLKLFNALAPLADVIQGKLNATMSLSGSLNNDFTPNLSTLSGSSLTEFLSSKIQPQNSKMLSLIGSKLQFINLSDVNLNNLKTSLSFENGKVNVKPFTFNYKDIDITTEGSHGFDKSMDYGLTFNVPAKYLGKEASALLANLKKEEADSIKVPIKANLKGSFTNPSFNTDLKSAVSNLTKQLAKREKEKLVGKGKDAVVDALGDLLGKDKGKDSTATDTVKKKDPVKDAAGTLIKGLFGKKKKKKDSVSN